MAATNYTPIQLYYSTTASAAPSAGNLANGELAINITDGKLYYKDNSGTVQVIATKGSGTIGGSNTQIQYNNSGALAGNAAMTFNSATSTVTLTTLNLTNALGATYGGTAQSTYTQGDILYSSATNTLSKLGIGTVNYILTSTGSVPQWVAPTSVTVQTANNLAGGAAGSVPYQSAPDTTTFLSIGAANRVMTSTGSAPQWVTALTGLTGVSSSSITNTSLTSGRVVYSTTGGAETDSANLTFNGTTLSTTGLSNTGLSTLVKTLTLGNSNFDGSAVFAAATPAKLYIGTGTVTDTTSAIGATNAVGAISSLAVTPIAATNTSVTYTNAATLYIAGAPSAGTNVTLTNPYSLYIAAGAAYFGGAVTFAGSASLAGLTLSGNLLFSPDNTYDIGASGATRARNLYLAGLLTMDGSLTVGGTGIVTGNLAVGSAVSIYSSRLTVAYNPTTTNGPIIVDNRAFGIDRGGAQWLGGQYNTAGDYRPYSGIIGAKENATDGNSLGFLAFYVNKNAADAAEAGRFNSSGSFLVGVNTPFNAASDVALFARSQAAISRVLIDNQNTTGTSSFEMSSYGGGWSLQVPGSTTFQNALNFKFGSNQRVRFASSGTLGFGTQGTTGDRLIDASFQGATLDSGSNQFGLVLNPTYGTNVTATIFNLYTGPNLTAGTTVNNVYNLYLEAINATGSTVNVGKWGLYQAGASDSNYFAGPTTLNNAVNTYSTFQNGNAVNYPEYTQNFSVGTTQWIRLCGLGNPGTMKIRYFIGASNSEEFGEVVINATYTASQEQITVTRQSYNSHLQEVRLVSSAGAPNVVYFLIRSDTLAPRIAWTAFDVRSNNGLTIYNDTTTPGAATASLVLETGSGTSSKISATNGLFGAYGGGVQFPSTQVASSNANTLDDYEEGTFANYLNFGSNTGSGTGIIYDYGTATYVKIGKVVTIRYGFAITNKGSSTGTAYLTNLPFRVESLSYADATSIAGYGVMSLPASNYGVTVVGQNNAYAATICTNSSSATPAIDHSNFNNASYIFGTLVYTTLD